MEHLEMDPGEYQNHLLAVEKLLDPDNVKKHHIRNAITKALKSDFTYKSKTGYKPGYEDLRARLIADLEKKFLPESEETKSEKPKITKKNTQSLRIVTQDAINNETIQRGKLGKDYD